MHLDEELLQPEHMEAARALIVEKYQWLQHITTAAAIPSIRQTGLEPRRDRWAMDHIRVTWGTAAEHVVCLYPVGCGAREQVGTKKPPFVKLAFGTGELPGRLTSDWTYGYTNSEKFRTLYPDMSLPELIVRAIEDRGSLLIYERIQTDRLHVRCKASTDSPSSWPRLLNVADTDILHFDALG